MGAPMARNMAAAGHEVRVYNRTRSKAEATGLPVLDAPTAEGADVVVTMLADGAAVGEVMKDIALDAGQLWWQASTVGLAATERMAEHASFVDGPVLGTKAPAEQGQLTVLASGPGRDRLAPLFDAVGSRTIDFGEEIGTATRMKLALNTWVVTLTEGIAETIALAEGLGLDPARIFEILDGGPMLPGYAKLKGTAMIERNFEPSFPLALAAKDAGLADEAARAAGLDLPLPRAIRDQMARAVADGHGEEDMAATIWAARSS
jgi:3-hydroxyisobutyrate dehydrogenase